MIPINPHHPPDPPPIAASADDLRFAAAILETVGALIIVLDPQARIVRFNRACEALTGYRAEEVLGRCFIDLLVPPEDTEGVRQVFSQLTAGQFPNSFENSWLTRTGERCQIAWSNTALLRADGSVEFVIGTGIDVTEHRRLDTRLRESEERFRQAFGKAPIGMALVRPDGTIIRANQALCDLLGFPEGELITRTVMELTHPQDRQADRAVAEEALTGKRTRYTLEKRFLRRDGAVVPTQLHASVVRNEQGQISYMIAQVEDISYRKQHEAKMESARAELEQLARLDPLTGVLNRRALMEALQREWDRAAEQGASISVAMLDVDHFKRINDSFGHTAGDQVLQTVARVLLRETRTSDVVARYGGEEFALILLDADEQAAVAIAERIRLSVKHTSRVPTPLTVSLGVACKGDGTSNASALLVAADAALYRSKREGRDRTTLAADAVPHDAAGQR